MLNYIIYLKLAAAVFLCIFLSACPGNTPDQQVNNNFIVLISDSGFSPSSLTIPISNTVYWTNAGSKVQEIYNLSGQSVQIFDTGNLQPGQGYSVYFYKPGTNEYSSLQYSFLYGYIIVTN